LRSAFRAYALEGHGAADITDRLNMLLADETESLQLATLCVLTFDPGAEEIVYTLAGHLPPLLLGPGGAADYLPAPGSPPLGAFPGTRYRENAARCAPGAALIVYSDGLVERRAEPLDQGLERLAAALRGAMATDAEGLCTRALDTLLAGEAPGDDIAILAISNVPLGGRLRVELPADPKVVGRVRFLLDRLMAEADTAVGENARYAIKLACTEACANAIEHAHGPESATFEVEAELADGEVVVRVRDHGVWRPEVDGDSGRGLDLMRAFVSTVDVRSGPDGTVVELRQPLGVAVAP
jgi:anti-sigma regulatory factor (Ser/Thr protein kinase)